MINKSQAKELASYLNLKVTGIEKSFQVITKSPSLVLWVANTNKDWQQHVKVQTKHQVEKWFRNTSQYLFELSEVHSFPTRAKLTKYIVKYCLKHNLSTVVDFGAGIGNDAIALSEAGITTTLADVAGKTLDYTKWRIKKRKLPVKIIAVNNNAPLKSKYDAILCLEVFQHLISPLKVARHLYNHLSPGGVLFVTIHFRNPQYLMALKKNYPLESSFNTELKKIGFKLLRKEYLWGQGKTTKYLYIYQK